MAVKFKWILVIILLVLVSVLGVRLLGVFTVPEPKGTPDAVVSARDAALKAAQSAAHELEGGKAEQLAGLKELSEDLDKDLTAYAEKYEASRIYVMAKGEKEFLLIADSARNPVWHNSCGSGSAFTKAYESGFISAEKKGWTDGTNYYWTAYAPLYNQDSEICLLLGADVRQDGLKNCKDWIEE